MRYFFFFLLYKLKTNVHLKLGLGMLFGLSNKQMTSTQVGVNNEERRKKNMKLGLGPILNA